MRHRGFFLPSMALILAGFGCSSSHGGEPDAGSDGGGLDTAAAWASLTTAEHHSCAITTDGRLFCWGNNRSGQLGDGTMTPRSTPVRVGSETDWIEVSAGTHHTCGRRSDRTLWCWGTNVQSQLGTGESSATPVQVGSGSDWAQVAAGSTHTCGLRDDGTLWCWGSNISKQLGVVTEDSEQPAPVQVGSDSDWAQITAGGGHTCGLREDGSLWCWGSGALGDGTNDGSEVPARIGTDTDWARVRSGAAHTCATKVDGSLSCWGNGGSGRVGLGSEERVFSPEQVQGAEWVGVSAGSAHTCGVRADGTLWCWGANGAGQLGIGTRTEHHEPVQVGSDSDWVAVAAAVMDYALDAPGTEHTCGLRNDGSIWCWGYNHQGQLGDGMTDTRDAPVQVVLPE